MYDILKKTMKLVGLVNYLNLWYFISCLHKSLFTKNGET